MRDSAWRGERGRQPNSLPEAPALTPDPNTQTPQPTFARHARLIALLLAMAAIPTLMLTLDPVVGSWANGVADAKSTQRYLAFSDPLGRAPLIPGVGVVLLIVAAAARSKRLARVGVLVLLTFGLCGGSMYTLKWTVRRPRPWATYVVSWHDSIRDWKWAFDGRTQSFPSGDVTCAAGLAMALFLAVRRGRGRYAFFVVPALSAAGRILGAKHYPSDCLAGLLLGLAMASLAYRIWPERPSDGRKHEDSNGEEGGKLRS
jgi:membrane-associated phospholipid phosphatase